MKFLENDLNKILLFLLVVLVIFLCFVGYGAYQLQAKNTSGEDSVKTPPENFPTQVDTNRCWQISQLRAENVELKKQLESMKNKIEDEGKTVDDLKGEIAFWFSFGSILVTAITMIVAIIAVVVPLYDKSEIKEKQKEVEEKQKEVEDEMESVKKSYNDMMEKVKRVRQEAYDIEPKEKFIQAMEKGKTDDIIKALGDIINSYPKYSMIWAMYGNRATMRFTNGDYVNALVDYTEAISKKKDVDYLYSGRAECYRKLAEIEPDKDKREGYKKQAEEDENTAEGLKQKGK